MLYMMHIKGVFMLYTQCSCYDCIVIDLIEFYSQSAGVAITANLEVP